MSEPGTGVAQPSRDTLTREKLGGLFFRLGLDRPRPIAFWFVDRPAEYIQLLKKFDFIREDWVVSASGPQCLYGIPLRQFTTSIATEEEYKRFPVFCKYPGIWVEMSDGNHVLLGEI